MFGSSMWKVDGLEAVVLRCLYIEVLVLGGYTSTVPYNKCQLLCQQSNLTCGFAPFPD